MTQIEYIFSHCICTGWQSVRSAFRIWADLMTDNFENYTLLKDDDPFEECYGWFWATLNEDETLPKEFLEYLQDLIQRIDDGTEELIPLSDSMLAEINDLIGDLHNGDV